MHSLDAWVARERRSIRSRVHSCALPGSLPAVPGLLDCRSAHSRMGEFQCDFARLQTARPRFAFVAAPVCFGPRPVTPGFTAGHFPSSIPARARYVV